MKKIICLTIASLCVVGLTACSQNETYVQQRPTHAYPASTGYQTGGSQQGGSSTGYQTGGSQQGNSSTGYQTGGSQQDNSSTGYQAE